MVWIAAAALLAAATQPAHAALITYFDLAPFEAANTSALVEDFEAEPIQVTLASGAIDAIASIRWTTVLGGQINTGIDNIRLGASIATEPGAVPEPASCALFALGLAAVGLAARKRGIR